MLISGNKSFGPEDFDLKGLNHNQAPDKSVYCKIIFLIFRPKHMLWVLIKNRLNETNLLSTQNTCLN